MADALGAAVAAPEPDAAAVPSVAPPRVQLYPPSTGCVSDFMKGPWGGSSLYDFPNPFMMKAVRASELILLRTRSSLSNASSWMVLDTRQAFD